MTSNGEVFFLSTLAIRIFAPVPLTRITRHLPQRHGDQSMPSVSSDNCARGTTPPAPTAR